MLNPFDALEMKLETRIHEREIGAKQWVLLRLIKHAYDDIADAEMDRANPDQAKVTQWRAAADATK